MCVCVWNKWTGWECAKTETKKGSVNSSAEPMGAHWGEEMAHKWDIETKHVKHTQTQKYKIELEKMQFCSNRDKIVDREAGVTS